MDAGFEAGVGLLCLSDGLQECERLGLQDLLSWCRKHVALEGSPDSYP
jgi:hypothetical protein